MPTIYVLSRNKKNTCNIYPCKLQFYYIKVGFKGVKIYVLSRNKKNNIYPCKPQFYYIKVGFKGVKIIQVCFRDDHSLSDFFRVLIELIFMPKCGDELKKRPMGHYAYLRAQVGEQVRFCNPNPFTLKTYTLYCQSSVFQHLNFDMMCSPSIFKVGQDQPIATI